MIEWPAGLEWPECLNVRPWYSTQNRESYGKIVRHDRFTWLFIHKKSKFAEFKANFSSYFTHIFDLECYAETSLKVAFVTFGLVLAFT